MRVFVSGRVQGVAFRWHTRERASELGVVGWVRNLPDGRVEARVEGEPGAVGAMLEFLARGPGHARVDSSTALEEEAAGFGAFTIERPSGGA